jgi:hypothetical protein
MSTNVERPPEISSCDRGISARISIRPAMFFGDTLNERALAGLTRAVEQDDSRVLERRPQCWFNIPPIHGDILATSWRICMNGRSFRSRGPQTSGPEEGLYLERQMRQDSKRKMVSVGGPGGRLCGAVALNSE